MRDANTISRTVNPFNARKHKVGSGAELCQRAKVGVLSQDFSYVGRWDREERERWKRRRDEDNDIVAIRGEEKEKENRRAHTSNARQELEVHKDTPTLLSLSIDAHAYVLPRLKLRTS